MQRTPEPELMLDPAQARAYAAADFDAPNAALVEALLGRFPELDGHLEVIDLGCGPGEILIRLARLRPNWQLLGVDGSAAMLDAGMDAIAESGRESQITLLQALLGDETLPEASAGLVISNSLLHHLRDPAALWRELRRLGAPGAAVFVQDLRRPTDAAEALALVETYAGAEPEVLQQDFFASLLAAYTVEEVRDQLAAAGLDLAVAETSDRHLQAWGRLP